MATISVTDQLGLDVDAKPAPTSALLKYFQQLPSLKLDQLDLGKVGGLTLDQPAIHAFSTGVSFQKPVDLGDGAPSLSVGAGVHGSLAIISDADDLPGDDQTMAPDTCYVSFGIEATANADVSIAAGALTFGAAPSTTISLHSYTPLPLKHGITLLQAVQQAVANFYIPAKSADLAGLPPSHIARVAVNGSLTLSGSADLLATANPLATASLPAPLSSVSVSAGATAPIGVSFEIKADYEVVARKLENGAVRIGWYHSKSTDVTVSAKVSGGVSGGIGGTDLFSMVLGAISASPQADLKELADAGVSDSQASAIQDAVKAAVARKLEIAIAGKISGSRSHDASFLYEIEPAALTDQSREAVDQALRGNLVPLHAPGLPGVTSVRSVWDDVRRKAIELDVNLLGILNFRSIASLVLAGKVLYDSATGSLTITDKATAQRIQSVQVNFGANTDKLRHVLAESFLITAAYQGTKQTIGGPALHCSHSFFELNAAESRDNMTHHLQVGVALGLFSAGDTALPTGVAQFGRTLCMVSTEYDTGSANRLFLDANDVPLGVGVYEAAGRAAINDIVLATDPDAVRLRPANDDSLWSQMKDVGQPGFAALFPGVPAPLVGALTADYSTIRWWADAMFSTAQKLAAFRLWVSRHPGAASDDSEFAKMRQDLAGHLRQVAANTREEFGQPWGLIAMSRLSDSRPGAKILITSPALVRNAHRALATATGS
jgi:hypothetical protein